MPWRPMSLPAAASPASLMPSTSSTPQPRLHQQMSPRRRPAEPSEHHQNRAAFPALLSLRHSLSVSLLSHVLSLCALRRSTPPAISVRIRNPHHGSCLFLTSPAVLRRPPRRISRRCEPRDHSRTPGSSRCGCTHALTSAAPAWASLWPRPSCSSAALRQGPSPLAHSETPPPAASLLFFSSWPRLAPVSVRGCFFQSL